MCEPSKSIISFKHCRDRERVFCFDIPDQCPLCNETIRSLNDQSLHIANENYGNNPIGISNHHNRIKELRTLPNPLNDANRSRCSLAIRPTEGTFLSDYQRNTSDLHICLITSTGQIVEFDKNGCQISSDNDRWRSSLIINMIDFVPKKLFNHWDTCLQRFIEPNEHDLDGDQRKKRWCSSDYDPIENNCFDFVLEFLRSLNLKSFGTVLDSKLKFCETFIVPRTKLLARYISLFRKIHSDGFVIL
ncbi:longevity assurance factor [Sarcoptes scabiei]|nr:longevity assurance factor [Sarcoptes scabiei]